MRRKFSRYVAGAAFLTLTTTGGPVLADDADPVGIVGDLVGVYPLVLEKADDTNYSALGGGADLPSLSTNDLDRIDALASTAVRTAQEAAAAGSACLPYTVHGLTRAEDEFDSLVIDDYVRFRLLWCADGFRNVQRGEGYCAGNVSVIYRVGVGRCWWKFGITGRSTMTFTSGGDYHVTLGVGTVATPARFATIRVDFSGGWQGPGSTLPKCPKPDVPRDWDAFCNIYLSSNW